MWAGVVVILAMLKFSTSPNRLGFIKHNTTNPIIRTVKYVKSLIRYVLKNFTLSYC